MLFDTIVVGPLGVNCFILGCPETSQAVVVDPGDEVGRIMAQVKQRGLSVTAVINTHGHFDHILAAQAVKETPHDAL